MRCGPWEGRRCDEAWCSRLAHEDRGDHEVQFVGEIFGQKLGKECAAALDHEAVHTAPGYEVPEQLAHRHSLAKSDDGGRTLESLIETSRSSEGGVHDLLR